MPGGQLRNTRRVRLKNGLETDKAPDVSLLWIIGGNYLGQTNDVAWKRRALHERMKQGRPVNPRRPKTSSETDIIDALTQRMNDGGLVCIHQDIFPNPTTECCDIVIPAAGWGEDSFCRYNAQRRLKLYERFQDLPFHKDDIRKPDENPLSYMDEFQHSPKPDWQILCDIANRIDRQLGTSAFSGEFGWIDSAELADEMAQESHRGKGLGLKSLIEFAKARHPHIPEKQRVHTILGRSGDSSNQNAEAGYLKSNYAVSELRDAGTTGFDMASGVYRNGVASNGVFLPLATRQRNGDALELVGHLSVRRKAPFYFVAADWQDIEPVYNRINGLADDDDWRRKGGVLVTNGRVNHLWNNMFHHLRNDYVNERYPEDMPGTVVEINPEWATEQSDPIENGDIVRLSSEVLPHTHPGPNDSDDADRNFRDVAYGVASLQSSVPHGMAFLMFSFPVTEGRHAFNFNFNGYVNNITDGYVDGVNPIAALKYGHAILTKVPADKSGYENGKFVSKTRVGPLYEQRNVVGPDPNESVGLDWEMRELIVRKGLTRASIHNVPGRKSSFGNPDALFSSLKLNTAGVRSTFKAGAVPRGIMKWELSDRGLIDEWHGPDFKIASRWLEQIESEEDEQGGRNSEDNQGVNKMIGFARVKEILNQSIAAWQTRTGRPPNLATHDFAGNSFGWETRDMLLSAMAFGRRLIEPDKIGNGRGAQTSLVEALKTGAPPFARMPSGGPFLGASEVQEIVDWIDAGTPENASSTPRTDRSDGIVRSGKIQQIVILPPFAIGRFGSATIDHPIVGEVPDVMDNYDIEEGPADGWRSLTPADTIRIEFQGTAENAQASVAGITAGSDLEPQLRFRGNEDRIRPVAPFLEVWALFEGQDEYVALTSEHISPSQLEWRVRVANRKASRRTFEDQDTISSDTGWFNNHSVHNLQGRAENFVDGKFIHQGTTYYPAPHEDVPGLRLRFVPAKGRIYGFEPNTWVTDDDQIVYDPNGPWATYERQQSLYPPSPSDTYNTGHLDDSCDGIVEARLTIEGTVLTASARITVGPPDFVPDSLHIRSLEDDFQQLVRGPDVQQPANDDERESIIEETIEIGRRGLETMRLMNTNILARVYNEPPPIPSDPRFYSRARVIHENIAQQLSGLKSDVPLEFGAAKSRVQSIIPRMRMQDEAGPQAAQMPRYMRGSDAENMALSRRQISTLRAAAQLADPQPLPGGTPRENMIVLIQTLSFGANSHRSVPLDNGNTLDTLFSNPEGLLEYLETNPAKLDSSGDAKGQPLIVPGDPQSSALYRLATEDLNPTMRAMFQNTVPGTEKTGVQVLEEWIRSLATS